MRLPLETIRFTVPLRSVQLVDRTSAGISSEELSRLNEEHFGRGFEKGRASLNEQLVQQRADLLELQNGILASMRQSIGKVVKECEEALIQMVLENVRRIVEGMPITEDLIVATVKEALASITDQAGISISLHPDDLKLLSNMSALVPPSIKQEDVTFTADERLSRGDCLVQTRFGCIDARRETKFRNLETALSW